MLDLVSIRDKVNAALADQPIAAAWLYGPPITIGGKLKLALLPTEDAGNMVLRPLEQRIAASTGIDMVIVNLRQAPPSYVESVLFHGALIQDRHPATREEFVASLPERHRERERAIEELKRGLRELRGSE